MEPEVLQIQARTWNEARTVRVFIPEGVNPREARVLVMLDGQNAFDRSTAFIDAWNAHDIFPVSGFSATIDAVCRFAPWRALPAITGCGFPVGT